MRKLLITLVLAALAVGCGTALAHNPPYGNDGNQCHGANQTVCRPDPQPDHGKDCEAHGNNPDGNDDHCGPVVATPTPEATDEPCGTDTDETGNDDADNHPCPTPTPTPKVTPTPVQTPDIEPTPTPGQPEVTPVPTPTPPTGVDTGGGQPTPKMTLPPTDTE